MLLQGGDAPECDAPCERAAAARLIDAGAPREAVVRLRGALTRFPDDPELPLLLARAYLADGNLFWAERSLRDALARRPNDPGVLTWLACVHVRQGDPELAAADLAAAPPAAEGPAHARLRLAGALVARMRGDDAAARAALAGVPRGASLYPEDLPLWRHLRRALDAWWLDPVSGSLDGGVGHTSNALAGSPTDPGSSGGPSALGLLDLRSRLAPPARGVLRPVFDLEAEGELIGDEEVRDLSSVTAALRPGVLIGMGERRLLAAYRREALWLDQSESRYADAHRLELELEDSGGRVAALGAGRRIYRDEYRTRWEGDLGIGALLRLRTGAPAAVGVTARLADATAPAWDQRGATAAAATRFELGRGFAARVALAASWDEYPHSGGLAGLLAFGTTERRRDLLGRLTVAAIGPAWRGARPLLEVRATRRDSTADDLPGFDFDFTETRVSLRVQWRFAADPWAPHLAQPAGHVPLDWGLGKGDGGEQERILDLLRQDEELRRGSSCHVN
jgi:hypothetical protein